MGVGAGGGRPREIFERLGLIYAIFKIKIVISSLDELQYLFLSGLYRSKTF